MKRYLNIGIAAIVMMAVMLSCKKESVALKGISLTPERIVTTIGGRQALEVKFTPEDASNKGIRWICENPDVAVISKKGIVTGLTAGKAMITAISDEGGYMAHCEVIVNEKPVPVTGLSLDHTDIDAGMGQEFVLTATIEPEDATEQRMIWTTSAPDVVSISNGSEPTLSRTCQLQAVSLGQAIITVKSLDGDFSAECLVKVCASPVTKPASHISVNAAVLSGQAFPTKEMEESGEWEAGILYSTLPDIPEETSVRLRADSFDEELNFSLQTKKLEKSTTYYYRTYMLYDGKSVYGDIMNFQSKDLSSVLTLLEPTEVMSLTMKLNASIDTTDCLYSSVAYGFEFTPEQMETESYQCSETEGGRFSQVVELQKPRAYYAYCAYLKLDDVTYSTKVLHAKAACTDLSEKGTANCYMITESDNLRNFKFKATKGCKNIAVNGDHAEELWETLCSDKVDDTPRVHDVWYSPSDNYIYFRVKMIWFNSIIALKNADEEILWSWHIWGAPDFETTMDQVYNNGAGTFMDRNLGAMYANNPADSRNSGLFYQWGRKDPFPAELGTSGESVAVTIEWPADQHADATTGTIAYTIAHPTTYLYTDRIVEDWLIKPDPEKDYDRWTTIDQPKSMYDPCPHGYRVPLSSGENVFRKAMAAPEAYRESGINPSMKAFDFGSNGGTAYKMGEGEIWYPLVGHRTSGYGKIEDAGVAASYLGTISMKYYKEEQTTIIHMGSNDIPHTEAYPIRCMKVAE